MISSPFGLLDCDVPVDGSVAFVVSSADYAKDCDHPVRVEACGGAAGLGGWEQRPDYPKMASTDAAAELWARTDLIPGDVDVAELYDGFTFLTFAWLEALGFCGGRRGGAVRRRRHPNRQRRPAAAQHLRRSALRRPHARQLGPARGMPAAAGRGGGATGPQARRRRRVQRRWSDRRMHAADALTGLRRRRWDGTEDGNAVVPPGERLDLCLHADADRDLVRVDAGETRREA